MLGDTFEEEYQQAKAEAQREKGIIEIIVSSQIGRSIIVGIGAYYAYKWFTKGKSK